MNNWLLIIVATVFIVCIVVGYVRGFLKLGISLLSTVLTLVIVLFLSPLVADALSEYTPVDDYIETRVVEAFIPDITGCPDHGDRECAPAPVPERSANGE